jgi:hypothetical protein
VSKLIGAEAMITIAHDQRRDGEGQYAKLMNVAKVMKGMSVPPAINKSWSYEIAMGENEVFNGLPDWMKEKIAACEEWTKPQPGNEPQPPAQPDADDDVPF